MPHREPWLSQGRPGFPLFPIGRTLLGGICAQYRHMTRAQRLSNESVMGFLALVALATALGPLVFDVTPAVERWLTFIEWLLVAAFAAELVVAGAHAPDFGA